MEKYKYSSLTDEQHKKIMIRIDRIKKVKINGVSKYIEKTMSSALWSLFCIGFITEDEMNIYKKAIEMAKYERKVARYGNLSER